MPTLRRVAIGLSVVWVAVVIVLGLTERRGVVGLSDSLGEPAQHFVSFAVLAVLLAVAFPERIGWIALFLGVGGLAGEFLQLTTADRQFDLVDIAMNMLGVAVGLTGVLMAKQRLDWPVVALAGLLLVTAPLMLVVESPPQTSFPDQCSTTPQTLGEPEILLDHEPLSPGAERLEVDLSAIKRSLVKTGELSVEIRFSTNNLNQTGPARVFTISNGIGQDEVNFHLGVDGDGLSIRFRTSCEWFNWLQIDDVLVAGESHHVVVTWSDGELATWLDAERVDRRDFPTGDFSSWDDDFAVLVGNEVGGLRPFDGEVESVRIWDRALDEGSIADQSAATAN